jgi:hypothetical protein
MPAKSIARKSNSNAPRGRRKGSMTQFPGIVIFCREVDRDPTHLWRVLTGKRTSTTLVNSYAKFLKREGQQWPQAAKVKPTAA